MDRAWRDLCPEFLRRLIHFFSLLSGGHSSLEPRLPIPNRTVKRVCADDSVPFAHAKVGYRQAIFKRKSPASKEGRAFLFWGAAYAIDHEVPVPRRAAPLGARRASGGSLSPAVAGGTVVHVHPSRRRP